MSSRKKAAVKSANTLVCGYSSSGKTWWMMQQIKSHKRVLCWDMKNEYARDWDFVSIKSKAALIDTLRRAKVGRFAFHSINPGEFEFFCKAAYAWGDCTVIAEELADVTTPAKAPLGWGMVLRRGRERRLIVYGVTQRPQESDKTIFGNAYRVHCHTLPLLSDQEYMAKRLGVPLEDVAGLDDYDYIERERKEIRRYKYPGNKKK